jgi:hypothetical protein
MKFLFHLILLTYVTLSTADDVNIDSISSSTNSKTENPTLSLISTRSIVEDPNLSTDSKVTFSYDENVSVNSTTSVEDFPNTYATGSEIVYAIESTGSNVYNNSSNLSIQFKNETNSSELFLSTNSTNTTNLHFNHDPAKGLGSSPTNTSERLIDSSYLLLTWCLFRLIKFF